MSKKTTFPQCERTKMQKWSRYEENGCIVEGPSEFVDSFAEICRKNKGKKDKWIEWLIAYGVKMAHPNDGYNNRKDREITPAYPYFDFGVEKGDQIAMGDYDEFVVVRVRKIRRRLFGGNVYEYWDYK